MAETNSETTEITTVPTEVVDRAKRMGWTPREEFKGDPNRFIEADKFVERAETELPILLERNRTLDRRLLSTESKLNDVTSQLTEVKGVLTEFREFASKGEERAYNKARKELLEQQKAAVAAADVDTYNKTQEDLAELEKTKVTPPPVVQEPQKVPQEVKDFVFENSAWYDRDPELTSDAISLHDSVHRAFPNLSLAENLKRVKEKLIRMHPDKLSVLDPSATHKDPPDNALNEDHKNPPSAALSGGRRETLGGSKSKAKTYHDLPPDAKQACDKFVKQIPGYKQEDYVKTYFAGEE